LRVEKLTRSDEHVIVYQNRTAQAPGRSGNFSAARESFQFRQKGVGLGSIGLSIGPAWGQRIDFV
jgi:hypothetical protein